MSEPRCISVRDWRRKPPLHLRVTQKPQTCWWWIKCTRCPHMAAVAIAPYIIRWGPDGWQDMLRRTGRCTACGKRGVALQHPPSDGSDTGWAPMPISQMAPVPAQDRADKLTRRPPSITWQPVSDAPFDCDLEVAVIDHHGPYALLFPCRRTLEGWIFAETEERIITRPTHWRLWIQRP